MHVTPAAHAATAAHPGFPVATRHDANPAAMTPAETATAGAHFVAREGAGTAVSDRGLVMGSYDSLAVGQRARMISVVVPVFNEEAVIPLLHAELLAALEPTGAAFEIVYVNDGSADASRDLLLERQVSDPRVTVVDLSRNWGHQPALTAGLAHARGDAVVLIDGDLQDPPAAIPTLVEAWRRGAEVVVAERRSRVETGLRRIFFPLFYRLLGFVSDFPIPLNAGIFGLLDRRAVDAVNALSETNRFLPGLRAWVGFRTEVVLYDRHPRAAGRPKQSFLRLLRYALDAIFSFSYKPLRLSLFAGLFVSVLALAYGAVLIVARLMKTGLFGIPVVDGYTSTIVSILFLGGIQLVSVGILGEYIGRVYDEVKRRPLFVVRAVHRRENGG
ncbi:MAG: glycosyltransferase family 2 protein [Acidobacteriota bacterium]